ncbi:MAG TPA: copper chaperone PCu(A)C [Gemmatimonadaceae bacterium]|nr:copper chaperone PCu(A)C [Gemmatimonadaceae bacterium]
MLRLFGRCDRLRPFSLVLGLALVACAQDARAIFIVNQPWVRPGPQGGSTEAYMDLTSTEGAALTAVSSTIATVAIRDKRAKPGRLSLPAGVMVRLAPGGNRLSLSKLAREVRLGERVTLTLTIESPDGTRQEIPVTAEARLRSPLDDERRAHGAH